MVKWALNFNKEIPMLSWEYLWKNAIKISTCNKQKDNCYKMLFRWYMSQKEIANINKGTSTKCWKSQAHKGFFYHMWQICNKTKKSWTEIYRKISKVLKCNLQKNPEMFLLELNMKTINIIDRVPLRYMITAARILYAQFWKQEKILDTWEWIQNFLQLIKMDKLTRKLKGEYLMDFVLDCKKCKEYMGKNRDVKGQMWALEMFQK